MCVWHIASVHCHSGALAEKLVHSAHAIWLLLVHMQNEAGAALRTWDQHFPIGGWHTGRLVWGVALLQHAQGIHQPKKTIKLYIQHAQHNWY